MQGGRANTGRKTTPMGGMRAARMTTSPQPAPVVTRPQPAVNGVPRSGSRVVAGPVDSAGIAEAGTQTTGGQAVQAPVPPKT